MTARFISNLTTLLAGAFLLAAALAFSTTVLGWLALGVGALVAATVACAFAVRGRGTAQRSLDVVVVLVAAWTIVASRCFGGASLKWLSFGDGALLALLAVTGLIVHEALLEIAVRRSSDPREDGHRPLPAERSPIAAGPIGI